MKNNWKKSLLGDVTTMQYGYTASADTGEVGPKFLRITDIVPDQIDWNEVPYCKISDKYYQKYKLKIGDVIVARTGATAGYAKLIREDVDAVFASYLIRVTPNTEEVDSGYLGIIIESETFKRFVESTKSGSAQPQANAPILRNFEFIYPDLNTQKTIFDILDNFNQLIRINNRRIQVLEEIAQRIYEEWFVHFKFPGHEKVKMVESELGKIPEGWHLVKSSEVISFDPKTIVNQNLENKYLPMGSISESSMIISNIEMRKGNSGSKFQNKDTLLARISPSLENGKTGFVNFLREDETAFGSTEFIVMRSKSVCPEYVYCLARSSKFRDTAIKSMRGATGRQRVQRDALENFKIALPNNNKLINEFHSNLEPMFDQIYLLHKKNEILAQTRDLLLPKLISGEIEL